ncbi:MAG: radical SAM protein [Candidatus Methanoperedens sp.]|nr:radical SAM protein [Candidatus Methanoperedens sp.]
MKIMLILPPLMVKENELFGVTPPLGIAYLASVLEKNSYEVSLLDCIVEGYNRPEKQNEYTHLGLRWHEIEERVRTFAPDVVGISCIFSRMFPEALKVAEIVKGIDTNIKVVMGGAHPSSVPYDVLSNTNIDFIVIGEGEMTLLELARCIGQGSTEYSHIDGLGYKVDGVLKLNPKTKFIETLDTIPFPARHLLPLEKYYSIGESHGGLKRNRYASIITSRGCPGNCVYCSIHTVWGRSWRPRSPANVIEEIKHLVNDYGIEEIHFEDDNLTFDRERARMIFQGIIDEGLDITWTTPNGVAIWKLDEELLKLMKKSGCYQLNVGIESGNEQVLRKIIKKPLKLEKALEIVKKIRELGIWTHGFFILGMPGETKQTMEDTINFAIKLDLDSANFFVATPYPGTTLYDLCKEHGFIQDYDLRRLMVQSAMISTGEFTSDEVLKLQKEAYQRFMLHTIKREIIYLNMVRRLMQLKTMDDVRFMYRKLSRLIKMVV